MAIKDRKIFSNTYLRAFHAFLLSADFRFTKLTFYQNFCQEHYQSGERFRPRSGPTVWFLIVHKGHQQMTEMAI